MNLRSAIGAFGCHQIEARCFRVRDRPMPLCARCLGASIGHVAALGVVIATGVHVPLWIATVCCIVMGIDWGVQEYLGWMSTNPRRLVTGIMGGFGVGSVWWRMLVWALAEIG
jgi:uncharacterized membrane protein